ncbi:protein kinase [Frankia sp. CNm7]|uniref:non-specific serine/threonine protein kinase n=1 Tax=Frankia nepalensis TaxID=1836974 RepID=A0A937UMR0_9ACTN|nr:WD40 repeat domain-containing serine/threonine protein kinase [Frankia nepalensis]MBL7495768.1 protein kinase [Frankia nepalensis]MBL7513011.1 protein kinase [Frankia nepalensis]MBL7523633.1 protein kinase [Frankia nepalensis]MBL7627122.1 protein kinase [Frankia nepalensis]
MSHPGYGSDSTGLTGGSPEQSIIARPDDFAQRADVWRVGASSGVRPLEAVDPSAIGRYRLEGVLGEGGFGRVYLGRSPEGRLVAVKVAKAERAADPEFRRLFSREARLARLVPQFCTAVVLDSGEDRDRPYLVTEFVEGPSLQEQVRRHGPLEPARLARVAVAVAKALTAIHRVGTVHRDLKPANVLLSPDGPLVIDFGIAVALDSTTQRTMRRAGTPGFMAPEQARGQAVGPEADIFAWGAVVAYAATGRHPYGEGTPEALIFRVVHEEPDLTGVPDPLRAIVVVAMRHDPAARPTATELHDRLMRVTTTYQPTDRALLQGPARTPAPTVPSSHQSRESGGPMANGTTAPVDRGEGGYPGIPPAPIDPGHEPDGLGRRYRPWAVMRRLPGNSGRFKPRWRIGLGLSVAMAVAAGVLLVGPWPAGDGTLSPEKRRSAAHELVMAASRAEEPKLAFRLALAAYRTDPTHETSLDLLAAADPSDLGVATLATLASGADSRASLFSPDGSRLATNGDGSIELWDTSARGALAVPLATFSGVDQERVFSPDGSLLVTDDYETDKAVNTVRLWDTSARGRVHTPLATFADTSFEGLSPDGSLLVTSDYDPDRGGDIVRLWDTSARGTVHTPLATYVFESLTSAVVFSPDGSLLAVGFSDPDSGRNMVRLWDTSARGEAPDPLATFVDGYFLAFSPDGSLLVTRTSPSTSRGRALQLWDTSARGVVSTPRSTFTGFDQGGESSIYVVFSPDGGLLASYGPMGNDFSITSVRLWETSARGTVETPAVKFAIADTFLGLPKFSPDSRLLVTDSEDGAVRSWDTSARGAVGVPVSTFTGNAQTSRYEISFDGAFLSTLGADGATRVWDTSARGVGGIPLITLAGARFAFSPKEALLATAKGGTIWLWDLDAGRLAERSCADSTNWLSEQEWLRAVEDVPYLPPCEREAG